MPRPPRLLTWPPLDPPASAPVSPQNQDQIAQMAVISGAPPTDSGVNSLFAANASLYVSGLAQANATSTPIV